jgi:hypothetical protein
VRFAFECDLNGCAIRAYLAVGGGQLGHDRILRKEGIKALIDPSQPQPQQVVLAFINYFSRTLAKPFNWKYEPCCWTL